MYDKGDLPCVTPFGDFLESFPLLEILYGKCTIT